jgi:hypothetical protein
MSGLSGRAQRLAEAIKDQGGIKMIAVDFDRTIVHVHTGGRWTESFIELSTKVRPFFKKFLVHAQALGLWVAIVTFSGQTQLVADTMSHALGGEDNIKRCYLRGNDASWPLPSLADLPPLWKSDYLKHNFGNNFEKCKLPHIISVVQHIQKLTNVSIAPNEVLYFDDDLHNIDVSRSAGIVNSAWCPATYDEVSCDHLLWKEMENFFFKKLPLDVLGASAIVESDVTASRLCCVA